MDIDWYIKTGLVGLIIDEVGVKTILSYLDGSSSSPCNQAAFSWCVTKADEFLENNVQYIDTYLIMEKLKFASPERQHEVLGSSMYSYNIPSSLHKQREVRREILASQVRYCRLGDVKVTDITLGILASCIDLLMSGKEEKIYDIIYSWLTPLYVSLNKVKVDVQVLARLLHHIPYKDYSAAIVSHGSMFRIHNKSAVWLAYVLGYPIHASPVPQEVNMNLLLNQIKKLETDRDTVTKRLQSIAVRHVISIIQENTITDMDQSVTKSTISLYESNVPNKVDSVGMDDICSYSPFDVVRYVCSDGKVVQLTRREYPYLKTSGRNPWSRELIPAGIIEELEHRQKLAEIYGLPPECLPLSYVVDTIFPRLRLEE